LLDGGPPVAGHSRCHRLRSYRITPGQLPGLHPANTRQRHSQQGQQRQQGNNPIRFHASFSFLCET
jgi:hypothetical protein